ncbi:23S rRNA (uracil(1939)-C(5))-methyltransferase RlmD [Motiliproteus sediminis]|uniref:23S rRNA (uracil(1939)-C(5))-methyltransferase RlmD n=1 Tax=Motiliproteus sediminis TaxID=1468178 RepID=UPI001AEFED31|nr:23S rRNA (uracil(1939)-C(5))-methyltransferase RlmD [Motiliproteus sediminis]
MRRGPRFYRAESTPRRSMPREPVTLTITDLSHDGRGVARYEGKTLFVHGALPGERITARITQQRSRFDEGKLLQLLEPSPARNEPRCAHYGRCGGCQLQHLADAEQIHHKQQSVLQQLQRIGGVEPETVLKPLDGPHWHYRRRSRLSISCHKTGGKPMLGFRQQGSKQLVSLRECPILEPRGQALLEQLQRLLPGLRQPQSLSHLEIALGDNDSALLIRHPKPLHATDQAALIDLCQQQGCQLYLQPTDSDSIHRVQGSGPERLHYGYQSGDDDAPLTLAFHPGDFTQVNATINQAMITRALTLLEPNADDRLLDLFCGLGNFTLPLAQRAGAVVGVEGSAAMVTRGAENAAANNLDNCRFYAADLTQPLAAEPWFGEGFSKILLDPPRAGALEVIQQLPLKGVDKLLYISCDPATFARDAGELAQRGLQLKQWGVMNMFPHTTHVESIGLFEPR